MLLIVSINQQKIKHKLLKRFFFYAKISCMGILVNLNDDRSELQKRIAADLQERTEGNGKTVVKSRKIDLEPEDIDGVEDSAYMKGYTKSKALNLNTTWLTLLGLLLIAAVVIVILLVVG